MSITNQYTYLSFWKDEVSLGEKFVVFTPFVDALVSTASRELMGKQKMSVLGAPFTKYNHPNSLAYMMNMDTVKGFSGCAATNGSKIVGVLLGSKSLLGERVQPMDFEEMLNDVNNKTKNLNRMEKILRGLTELQKNYYEEIEMKIGQAGSLAVILSSKDVHSFFSALGTKKKSVQTQNVLLKILKN